MEKSDLQQFETLDIYLSAFIHLAGFSPSLQIKNNRVVFIFPACDDLYRLMSNFNANVNVPVADFVTAIKSLRGQMLAMKGTR